ncbi:MAG: septum formation initiator family protein [Nitrospirae bacterium]|nr:septum formation initiator family protein [Nitrospirota bacterium]
MKFPFPFHLDRAALLRGTLMATLLVAATLLYLWQHMVMVDTGYRIENARKELARLSHQRAELLMEVASLSSLPRIERMAREQLGMVRPAQEQLVRVLSTPAVPVPGSAPGSAPAAEGPLLLAASSTR